MGSMPLHICFDEMDGFIKIYDEIRYFVLFGHGWYDAICDRIKYLISEKVRIQMVSIKIFQELELILIILYLLKYY